VQQVSLVLRQLRLLEQQELIHMHKISIEDHAQPDTVVLQHPLIQLYVQMGTTLVMEFRHALFVQQELIAQPMLVLLFLVLQDRILQVQDRYHVQNAQLDINEVTMRLLQLPAQAVNIHMKCRQPAQIVQPAMLVPPVILHHLLVLMGGTP
jgi:hypothetical protein